MKNLSSKAVLLLDNAPSHPPAEELVSNDVRVVYLLPNVTSIIQPLDQGAIALLKRRYRKNLVSSIIQQPDVQSSLKKIDVKLAIYIIAQAWNDVSSIAVSKFWHKLWPSLPVSLNDESKIEANLVMESIRKNLDIEILATISNDPIWKNIDEKGMQNLLEIDRHDNDLHENSEEIEAAYVPNGNFRRQESDVDVGISFEEGAAVIDRAIAFLKQENKVPNEIVNALVEERDRILLLTE